MEETWKEWLSQGRRPKESRVHVDTPDASEQLARQILAVGQDLLENGRSVILLCIGTDRSIGDALGPLVGALLSEREHRPFLIRGTLERPVHAGNLAETIEEIAQVHSDALVLALDACLGRAESVGHITVGRGPLRPGAGVGKPLPQVGDLHITGVVNVGGFMEYFVLQNTRLHTVMQMARVIADGIGMALGVHARLFRSSGLIPAELGQFPLQQQAP